MSRWQFKRFEAMQDSKKRIIENTKKQIHTNAKSKSKHNSFSIAAILLTSCVVLFGLIQLIVTDKTADLPNFEGDLYGMIYYEKDEFYFRANEDSLQAYSELKEAITTSTKFMFSNNMEQVLRNMLNLRGESGSVHANFYIKGLKRVEDAYSVINVGTFQMGVPYENLFTFELTLDENSKLLLDAKLEEIYSQFSERRDRALLQNLEPHEIFQLYQFAIEQNNVRVKYELIHEEGIKPTFEEFNQAPHDESSNPAFKNTFLYVKIEENQDAYIFTPKKESFFGLMKVEGVWLVNFLPEQ
ncbi:hypothetical protein P9B03_13880 [Metasolibacillus meyeri]|uniref:Uncharacterized protein n=1 Tax=Metasolibacillus meyeri TaxID=1071052 RepID=A0AAW9NL44_9BACL|nr:hypothetical protein [Metasolibacillus meyeri]MEC1179584.1 hypothetical protein [Metasolibacillus meyeri]